ncbi:MAG: methionine synthase [Bacteroidales bacterium]|nr:methionine synthase [Bacteroidales bacterium]
MDIRNDFRNALKDRVLLLDGAMGTQIQKYAVEGGNNESLNLSRPDIILDIHRSYIDAGADIIETNTFGANRLVQAAYALEDRAADMAREGAAIARKAADESSRKIWVAGSIGPTSKSLTLAQDVSRPAWRACSFDRMSEAFEEQVRALVEGGVDMLLLETAFDALNVKAALYAVMKVCPGFPVIVSVSVSDRSGRTLTGQTLEAFYTAVRHYPLSAFGINCSLGAGQMVPLIQEIAGFCDVPVICYPNAGLPNETGGYDQTPAEMAAQLQGFDGLVNILGGCCGTTPEHIRAFPKLRPRPAGEHSYNKLTVSGLEVRIVDTERFNLTLVGERTNVAGSRRFARLIAGGDYDEALRIAAGQVESGAPVIDINMDDALLDGPVAMETFVRIIQNDPASARAALMIDSSRWDCILAGLKNAQGKCIVNSVSLKEGEAALLEKASEIHRLGAAMVVMAFDETGQATTYRRKIEICERAYRILTGAGIPAEDIIFDVNVLSVGTGIPEHDRYGVDFIEAVRWIKQNLPGASTSGGISNLSFSFRGNDTVRSAMHSVFLYHAVKAGLDMAIVNPAMLPQYDDIPLALRNAVEDVILCRDGEATERLVSMAATVAAQKEKTVAEAPVRPSGSVEERLERALVSGDATSLEDDVKEALAKMGQAVKVIEGPLMAGMEEVGRRFGEGKMFLPQVVKSAKVMKDAVAVLEPYMEEGENAASKPVYINATVKGDVHDIGKNIVGIVLRCNGFEVVDLGVMVDKETILEAAEKHHAAIIGVSGLITPSLFQMEELCREMSRRGLSTPLFVGGATTTPLHTAIKLATLYPHVFHSADASAGAVLAKRCIQDREAFEAAMHKEQERLRELYEERKAAPSHPEPFPESSYIHDVPQDIPLTEIPLSELIPLFDWTLFRTVWGVKEPSEALTEEGRSLLENMAGDGAVKVRIAARFFAASRKGNEIDLGVARLPMLRQEEGSCRSLADFVPSGETGPFGIFAISVHGAHHEGCTCEACSNEYQGMMERAVRVTLAEAASAWLDLCLKSAGTKTAKPAAGYASCPDHSLKRDILSLLPDGLDITLTETCAMKPEAAICGFVIFHPQAGYPEIRHISQEQYDTYARARGFSPDEARLFLSHLL